MRRTLFAAVLLAAGLATTLPATAAYTYRYSEGTGAGNATGGLLANPAATPVTFEFTVAALLGPSQQYNFGYANIEPTWADKVLDFAFTDGTALSTMHAADLPQSPVNYGTAGVTHTRISVITDASAAIGYFNIEITARTAADPNQVLTFQLQHLPPGQFTAVVMGLFDTVNGRSSGSLQCVVQCTGGAFALPVATPVPEPTSWALWLLGLGAVARTQRRRLALG